MCSWDAAALVETVVKVGGSILREVEAFDSVLAALRAGAQSRRLLIVPGGGAFADTVRDVDRRLGLSDSAAHWMAVLAMDQHAHLIAARLAGAVLVAEPREIAAALEARDLPVLAPSRWLRAADPLRIVGVTSDSIAGGLPAGSVRARSCS